MLFVINNKQYSTVGAIPQPRAGSSGLVSAMCMIELGMADIILRALDKHEVALSRTMAHYP
jgi:hypothetical protein